MTFCLLTGITADGFMCIAIVVLAETNDSGNTILRSTAVQITSLTMVILVAHGLFLVDPFLGLPCLNVASGSHLIPIFLITAKLWIQKIQEGNMGKRIGMTRGQGRRM
ncbi:hypothetical protein L6164_001358 [Bauhinia variegata]|uniref:Uncharacterized protein n=1 Tax=Bauhinia variegata TaxID=167791 RepID=A0ACB9Q9K5_BAUVA|nr:hypothetical protein L6164_001358 [Bauhinia variegata]